MINIILSLGEEAKMLTSLLHSSLCKLIRRKNEQSTRQILELQLRVLPCASLSI